MTGDFDYITAKALFNDEGANADSSGNRFDIDPATVVWYQEPDYAGFCGCGNPEIIDQALIAYLGCINHDVDHWDDRPPLDEQYARCGGEVAWHFCAYMADALGWTEHGGSVLGAWPTDTGVIALANLTREDTTP